MSFDNTALSAVCLKGDFVELEPVSMDGFDDFYEYSQRSELYEYLEFAPFISIDETRQYLEKLMRRSTSPNAQYWFIKLTSSRKVVGSMGLHSLQIYRDSVEIGYGVSPDYWGQGVFTAACSMLVEHVFDELKLHRIVARTAQANIASIRGLEKMRFRQEGVMRDYYRALNGSWFDALLMSRLSTD